MAVKAGVITDVSGDGTVIKVVWSNMVNGDTGEPVGNLQWIDRSVQVGVGTSGTAGNTFGAAGNVQWQGSNVDATFVPPIALSDPQGVAANFTANDIKMITEGSLLARPAVTAGDGTTNLTVVLIARRQQPLYNG